VDFWILSLIENILIFCCAIITVIGYWQEPLFIRQNYCCCCWSEEELRINSAGDYAMKRDSNIYTSDSHKNSTGSHKNSNDSHKNSNTGLPYH